MFFHLFRLMKIVLSKTFFIQDNKVDCWVNKACTRLSVEHAQPKHLYIYWELYCRCSLQIFCGTLTQETTVQVPFRTNSKMFFYNNDYEFPLTFRDEVGVIVYFQVNTF